MWIMKMPNRKGYCVRKRGLLLPGKCSKEVWARKWSKAPSQNSWSRQACIIDACPSVRGCFRIGLPEA